MARANAAYYANHDPFADFTTSPEITQVFGEVLGLWAAVTWEAMGQPDPVLLVECGPGRGTLMADALRAVTQAAPGFRAALRIHLVETSPRLRAAQAAALPDGTAWHDDLASVPPGPMLLLANEFLDALPIRQFVRRGPQWTERFVSNGSFLEAPATDAASLLPLPPGEGRGEGVLAAEQETTGAPSAQPPSTLACTDPPPHPNPLPEGEGAVRELCEPAQNIAASIATRVTRDGGAALFLDYGPERSAPGDSLQALKNGKPADPLAAPGEADLTAHVDFAALARAASGARVHGPAPQGLFLARLGLFQRSGRLARTQPPAKAASLMQAAQRLAEPDQMGRLFKALCIAHPDLPTPAGFEP
ncbi:MAG: class I SAM-dependent methyltransferase [Janthinobacterium lividum]